MKKFPLLLAISLFLIPSVSLLAQSQEDRQAIEQSAQDFVEAFNQGDAETISTLFTESAEYITAEGVVHSGRSTIAADFAAFFENNQDLQIGMSIDEIRFLSPNVAIEEGRSWRLVAPVGEPGFSRYTATHSKVDGQWRVARIQDNNESAPSHYSHLQSLEWLIGTWGTDFGDTQLQTTFEWTANKSFIKRSFKVTQGDEVISSGLQVIGWDPKQEQMVSWMFGAEGGHGTGVLSKQDGQTVLQATSVLAEGAIAEATNLLSKIDDNHFTWQSRNRTLNGEPIADVPEVTLVRIPLD